MLVADMKLQPVVTEMMSILTPAWNIPESPATDLSHTDSLLTTPADPGKWNRDICSKFGKY